MSFAENFQFGSEPKSAVTRRFAELLAPKTGPELEKIAEQAERMTRQFFGKTMRLFAPLYLSNECINICKYCGFSRDNPINRVTLSIDQVEKEARHLTDQGFRSILLVAGEHPKFVSTNYLEKCVERLQSFVPAIALEVGPMEKEEYEPLVRAGAEGLIVYQETYDPVPYAELHTAGPKQNFAWRLECPERAYAAGFRRLGIGALFGLSPWQQEALALARHIEYLLKHCWKASLSISLPRLRPAAGEFVPRFTLSDRELTQVICALRICFPQVGIVLSTREAAPLRDGLVRIGVTTMSAGSHTEPGGYTQAGEENIHKTERGRQVAIVRKEGEALSATEQFHIADERSPQEVAAKLRSLGLEPVWKDWDGSLLVSHVV